MSQPNARILVCGGGNGAHTLAAIASSIDGVDVNVMTLFKDEAERWAKALGDESLFVDITYNDETKGEARGKPKVITKDPAVAMEGVDGVFFVVPAFAHQEYFDTIAPYIKPNTVIVGMPGQAGFEFQALSSLKENAEKCAIVGLETLPWACRILEFGKKVQVLGMKETLGASLIPGKRESKLPALDLVQKVLGSKPVVKQTKNYIAVNLMAKSIIHPPLMYGKWRDWDGKPLQEPPLFYQGVNDEQADLLSKISDEIIATANEIHRQRPEVDMSDVIPIAEWFKIYYCDLVADATNLKTSLQTNKAYNGLLHPMKKTDEGLVPDFTYRYMAEDIPFGLVVMKGIADCAGVKTPTMDIIIQWAQKIIGKEYIVGTELKGADIKQTRAPQAYGFTTLQDLLK